MWSAHFLFLGCLCCVARVSTEMPKRTYPRHFMGWFEGTAGMAVMGYLWRFGVTPDCSFE